MASQQTTECPVCVGKFTSVRKAKITCAKCNYECCKQCVQTYLLSNANEPSCMNCSTGWSQEFLFDNLSRSFMNGTYKKHKANLLFEIQKSRIPETMPRVEMRVEADKLHKELAELKRNYMIERNRLQGRIAALERGTPEAADAEAKTATKNQFLHKCPQENCNGFLSSKWKCAACNKYSCHRCFEKLGESKEENEAHVCNEDNVKSAEFIKKDSRPCPKCATRIHKISGCDQMWCTQCHVAFSWTSGKQVIGGVIHNPHYFNYMFTERARNGNVNPIRNPGDNVCGGLPDGFNFGRTLQTLDIPLQKVMIDAVHKRDGDLKNIGSFSRSFFQKNCPTLSEEIMKNTQLKKTKTKYVAFDYMRMSFMLRGAIHTNGMLQHIRRELNHVENFDEQRIGFIMNKYSEKTFRRAIQMDMLKREKRHRLHDILEVFDTIATENMNSIYQKTLHFMARKPMKIEDFATHFQEMETHYKNMVGIKEYCQEQLKRLTTNYKIKPIIFREHFEIAPLHGF